jgi:hypothetical protein
MNKHGSWHVGCHGSCSARKVRATADLQPCCGCCCCCCYRRCCCCCCCCGGGSCSVGPGGLKQLRSEKSIMGKKLCGKLSRECGFFFQHKQPPQTLGSAASAGMRDFFAFANMSEGFAKRLNKIVVRENTYNCSKAFYGINK